MFVNDWNGLNRYDRYAVYDRSYITRWDDDGVGNRADFTIYRIQFALGLGIVSDLFVAVESRRRVHTS